MRRPRGACKREVLGTSSIGLVSQPKILSANPYLQQISSKISPVG
jgi:hypothetical protein